MADWPYSTERWQRVRKRQLAREPLCRACHAEGIITPAREVDHIVTVRDGGTAFDPANLQSLCSPHHSIKTNSYDAKGKDFGKYMLRGCNPDGSPRDPSHPWADQSLQPDAHGPARATKLE
jgi:5-methylcytosine-specific restriction protein A